MKILVQDSLSYLLAQMARVLTPALQRRVVQLCLHLVDDVPRLGAAWVVHFDDPGRYGLPENAAIDATLRQYGRFVRGYGHLQGEPGDVFEYKGTIKRNVLYGTFRRIDAHVLAGTGTFVLKIRPDSRDMEGHCTWYDNQLDGVWSSMYAWTRKD